MENAYQIVDMDAAYQGFSDSNLNAIQNMAPQKAQNRRSVKKYGS